MKINDLFLILFTTVTLQIAGQDVLKGDLVIFHAGSLSVPFKKINEEFSRMHPGVKILPESAGSVESARKVTDLHRSADILASSDYSVIDHMLIPRYADWNIRFAGNEIVIAWTPASRYQDQVNQDNWFDILLKEDVAYGRSDPNADPCGYRSLMTMQLAEIHYRRPGLAAALEKKDRTYIRPKEVDLLALLETRSIDYIFIYRSVAVQHELTYLTLPDEINLKNPEFSGHYKKARVAVRGKAPGTADTVTGQPVIYGVSVLKEAPNRKAAIAWLDFLLSEKGRKIMSESGQNPVGPLPVRNFNHLPEELKKYCIKD